MNDDTYRKMCDDIWIQEMWEIKKGDKTNHGIVFNWWPEEGEVGTEKALILRSEIIWLPRVDDWIEMLNNDGVHWLLHYDCVIALDFGIQFKSDTPEEALCLAVGWVKGWEWKGGEWVKRS